MLGGWDTASPLFDLLCHFLARKSYIHSSVHSRIFSEDKGKNGTVPLAYIHRAKWNQQHEFTFLIAFHLPISHIYSTHIRTSTLTSRSFALFFLGHPFPLQRASSAAAAAATFPPLFHNRPLLSSCSGGNIEQWKSAFSFSSRHPRHHITKKSFHSPSLLSLHLAATFHFVSFHNSALLLLVLLLMLSTQCGGKILIFSQSTMSCVEQQPNVFFFSMCEEKKRFSSLVFFFQRI